MPCIAEFVFHFGKQIKGLIHDLRRLLDHALEMMAQEKEIDRALGIERGVPAIHGDPGRRPDLRSVFLRSRR